MNIVLISIDCVRHDYLTHPVFERLRREGRHFTRCIVQGPHTSTSHSSILTGLYPFHHGVRYVDEFHLEGLMLQERLKEARFATAAFVGGIPLTQGDMDRGFDVFKADAVAHDIHEGRLDYTPANVLVTNLVSCLTETPMEDKFAFVHMFDLHLTMRAEFGRPTYSPDEVASCRFDRRERRYREEIEFIGIQIERLLELAPPDLLILTGDHGEKMPGEKHYPYVINSRGEKISSHFHEAELFDIQLIVPLILWGEGITPSTVETQVRSIDIAPTVLDILGLPGAESMDGVSLYQVVESREAYSETYFAQLVEANKFAVRMNAKYDWGWRGIDSLVSIRSDRWKLICLANGAIEPYLLFDLQHDPSESNNLLKQEPFVAQQLLEHLLDLIAEDRQWLAEAEQVDEAILRRLEGLGYL